MGQALPISYEEMTAFAGKVLRINGSLESLFYRCIEDTDEAVLYDRALKKKAEDEAEEKARKRKGRGRSRRPQ